MSELHAHCHDLVCNADRKHPRGASLVGCSCRGRDTRQAELTQQLAALTEAHERLKADQRELVAALVTLMAATETADNPCDQGVSEHHPAMQQARVALARMGDEKTTTARASSSSEPT